MKQADEAIDRVLTGLRESEAPTGLEKRILQAMQAQGAGESAKTLVWWSWPKMTGYAALLAGLLVVIAVSVPHRVRRAVQEPEVARRVKGSAPIASENEGAVMQAKVRRAFKEQAKTPALVRFEKADAALKQVPGLNAADPDAAEDTLAREEMLAPSHPAPPLPMTAQEKSLIQAVRWHDSDELAMLNPEEQDKVAARNDEAFKKYFGIRDSVKQDGPATDEPAESQTDGAAPPVATVGTSQTN